ncbi:MAG: serine protease [Rhodocyclaceae bacterium]
MNVGHPSRRTFVRGLGALLLSPYALAALPDTVARIKPSIVAVGTFQRTRNPSFRFLGTGFAVGDGRLIATNAHVLPDKLAEAQMETFAIAVPDGDSGTVAVRPARNVAMEKERDLAVLAIDGNALGFFPVTHRGIIAAISPIGIPQERARELDPALVRRLASDPFRVYQLDATAYPGNSGSPVYDPASGRVLGVVNMVFVKSTKENVLSDPSGISYAIPIDYLATMLDKLGAR